MKGEPWKVARRCLLPRLALADKTSGQRVRRGGFVAALAIADERWLKEDYGHQGFQFIWGDTAPGVTNVALQDDLGEFALMKARERAGGEEGVKPLVKALTRESLGGSVTSRGDSVIFTMSQLPIIMMVIAVLAVLNTVLASVQSRRREFGLMRAVGVPGGMVMRMLWAETLMISLCAVIHESGAGRFGGLVFHPDSGVRLSLRHCYASHHDALGTSGVCRASGADPFHIGLPGACLAHEEGFRDGFAFSGRTVVFSTGELEDWPLLKRLGKCLALRQK